MKKFIKRILQFVILALIVFAGFSFIAVKTALDEVNRFKLSENKDTIILGDSHTQCALNDSILVNMVNISESAEPYLYSFIKLRKYSEANPHIKNVVLGYSYNSLSEEFDRRTLTSVYIKNRFRYFVLMNREEFFVLLNHNPGAALQQITELDKYIFYKLIYKAFGRKYGNGLKYGGYYKNEFKQLEATKQKLANGSSERKFTAGKLQEKYLLKISEYCKEKGLKLFLLNTPVYIDSSRNFKVEKDFYYKFYSAHLTPHTLMNYSELSLPDSYFADIDHLNKDGAKYFCESMRNMELPDNFAAVSN